jgi:MFS family permease
VFTVFSILLAATWMHGTAGALWMVIMRVLEGVGGAMLLANSNAIITDAFPVEQRGLALGLNQVAGIAGSFLGLILGGLLAPVEWHLVFLVSVPFGVFGTFWAYWKLHDTCVRHPGRLDWWGNLTFATGLIAVLVGITYGIQPYGGHAMGWTNRWCLPCSWAACSYWESSVRSRPGYLSRCSSCGCSASAHSPRETWPACCPDWAAEG